MCKNYVTLIWQLTKVDFEFSLNAWIGKLQLCIVVAINI